MVHTHVVDGQETTTAVTAVGFLSQRQVSLYPDTQGASSFCRNNMMRNGVAGWNGFAVSGHSWKLQTFLMQPRWSWRRPLEDAVNQGRLLLAGFSVLL